MPKLSAGSRIPLCEFTGLDGRAVPAVAEDWAYTHLQFRRFAGCPICNLHLREFARENARLQGAGVRELVFFHSSAEELRAYAGEFPFPLLPDPEKEVYRAFGVEASLMAVLHPKVWWSGLKGLFAPGVRLKMENGPLGLPTDFLIGPNGVTLAAKYGSHADDHWSVEDLLEIVEAIERERGLASR